MKYIVQIQTADFTFFLRLNGVWTSCRDRATEYDSESEAANALANAKRYTKPKLFKVAQIISG